MLDALPLWVNLAIFAAAAVCVWFAGVRLEAAVQTISEKTGIGSAFGGLVLLGLATSLPELATTITGGTIGNAALVSNNLLGGVMMQTAVLSVADLALRRGALTFFAPKYSLLLGGVSLASLLGVALTVLILGDTISFLGVGLGSTTIFAANMMLIYLNYRSRKPRWNPAVPHREMKKPKPVTEPRSLRQAWIVFATGSAAIFLAGSVVMLSAETLTKQTGLAASFVGATLVAITTSLPELSTTISAVRRGHNAMAVSNIFGSNLWDVSLLFIGDIFYRQGPLLANAPRQAMFTCALGIVMTCVYLWGLLERRNKTLLRAGIDSIVVLAIYFGGLTMLYRMG